MDETTERPRTHRSCDVSGGQPDRATTIGRVTQPVPPVNVLRLSLHPDGMASRILNLGEWRAHLLAQLHRRAAVTGDARLHELHDELRGYPGDTGGTPAPTDVVLPLRYRHGEQELSFFSISAVVGNCYRRDR